MASRSRCLQMVGMLAGLGDGTDGTDGADGGECVGGLGIVNDVIKYCMYADIT